MHEYFSVLWKSKGDAISLLSALSSFFFPSRALIKKINF